MLPVGLYGHFQDFKISSVILSVNLFVAPSVIIKQINGFFPFNKLEQIS